MNFKSSKKWLVRIVVTQIVLAIVAYVWVDYQITDMWGGHTVVVDHTQFETKQALIVIENVNALSVDGLSMRANQTIVIDQGKIRSVGLKGVIPSSAEVVDGTGKYLIPGLIDSHVHLWQSPNDLLLYLANGVTHVRELNGTEEHLRWRHDIEQGRMGPRLFVASRRLGSNSKIKGWFDRWTSESTSIDSPKNASTVLRSFSDRGYDATKVYSVLSKEDFTAINIASEATDIPLLGHIPIGVTLSDVWQSNLTELAHIEELMKALDREFGGYSSHNAEEFLQFVRSRSEDVSARLVAKGMAVVTTLWLMESFSRQKHDISQALRDVNLSYVNPGISELSPLSSRVMGWLPDSNIYRIGHNHTPEQLISNKTYWDTYAKANQLLLRAMNDKGVRLLAGTDANVPIAVPGFSIHDELQSLTNAGMTPQQALYSATAAPAEWMNTNSGKVAQGYTADLVLLDANPLEDIKHTKAINSVIRNGRLLTSQTLSDMLNQVQNANEQSRTTVIGQYD